MRFQELSGHKTKSAGVGTIGRFWPGSRPCRGGTVAATILVRRSASRPVRNQRGTFDTGVSRFGLCDFRATSLIYPPVGNDRSEIDDNPRNDELCKRVWRSKQRTSDEPEKYELEQQDSDLCPRGSSEEWSLIEGQSIVRQQKEEDDNNLRRDAEEQTKRTPELAIEGRGDYETRHRHYPDEK